MSPRSHRAPGGTRRWNVRTDTEIGRASDSIKEYFNPVANKFLHFELLSAWVRWSGFCWIFLFYFNSNSAPHVCVYKQKRKSVPF